MKVATPFYVILFASFSTFFFHSCAEQNEKEEERLTTFYEPYDEFYLQKAYPDDHFDLRAYTNAFDEARTMAQLKNDFPGFDEDWIVRGPGNIGARVNTVAIHPQNDSIMFAGFSAGGLFRTRDNGANWTPVFDDQDFLAIGDITFDPNNPETVYVGTGDPNISAFPFIGDGVYKSTDGGDTWTHLGLTDQRIVSKIIVDPSNSDIVYVACMGIPFERNNDRGLYKSTDGGSTWEQMLLVSDQAGIIDMVIDPNDPNILYAAAWDRIRNNTESMVSGPNAKIFKTTDGGANWTMLEGGLPQDVSGRIGLAISATNSDLLFALYVGTDSDIDNVFRTIDAGETWEPILDFEAPDAISASALGGFGWYFGKIRVNPLNDNDLFILGVDLWRSLDGGITWFTPTPPWWQYSVHADKHDLVFSSTGGVILATDGGLYRTEDEGTSWQDIENIPATQFYRVAYNPHQPDLYYGGAQDNGTTAGTNLTDVWPRIYGGDGFQPAFHPTQPEVMYVETQNGRINVSTDGGASFFSATDGIDDGDRKNWDMQYFISPHNPDVMYTGTYRVYKSESGVFPFWIPVSEDLTDGLVLHPRYHTITTIYESPVTEGLVYVGTVDGNVWRTDDGGENWISISEGLPDRYVSDVKASADTSDFVYVSHSGYKDNEFIPRIFRSEDRGETWEDISADLPDLAINDIYVLPGHQDTVLFVGTDGGVYGTMNAGSSWERLGENMPTIAIYDLDWNVENNELIAGTHARSIMTYPLDSIVVDMMPEDTTVTTLNPVFQVNPLKVYPSPAIDIITVEFQNNEPGRAAEIVLINQQGQVLGQRTSRVGGKVTETFDVSNWPSGIYRVSVKVRHEVRSTSFIIPSGF